MARSFALPAILLTALALAGCGKQLDLKPADGHPLPPKPATAATQPTPKQLLTPSPQSRPERVDDLLKKSQERRVDPFDQPPPG